MEFVYSIADNVLDRLASHASQEISLAWGAQLELTKLNNTLSTIKLVVEDAEKKQVRNSLITRWLGNLKDVCHDVDDVLDELEFRKLRLKVEVDSYGKIKGKVCQFFSRWNLVVFNFKMGHKVKEMRKRLVEINNEKREFALFEFLKIAEDPSVLRGMHDNKRETDSLVEASDVIGRDDDKKQIISHLLNNTDISNEENVSVISILGLGGLGKTTLAKLVYNDSMVEENFDMKMWVCVSDNFDIQTLTCGIINAVIEQKCEDASLDLMKRRLQDTLRGRKFFLVLDDIWDTESIGVTIEKWICLKNMLNVGAKGSKIIITTRHGSVASLMSPVHMHSLKGLSDRDCMSLFIKRAFKRGEEQRYQHLIEIGNDIVKKCGGVPLAVATVGSMLYLKTDKHQWLSVRDDDMWSIRNDNNHNILPALKLSYDALPQHMKPCFAFCSLFPKDYVFNSGLLVPLWIAQGYLMTSKKNEDLEHMGEDYIRQFCSRSLFQVEIDLKTSIVFKIHDLVHDLAISVAQVEYSTVNFRPSSAFEMVRHVSISKIDLLGEETQLPDFMLKSIKLRTILIPRADCQMNQRFVKACISRFKCVRVLDLSGWPLEELPSSIDSLFHLRFLNLSDSRKIKRLPNSISKLLNLETLCLIACDALEEIPKDIGNLINLRYLVITTQQTYLPKGIRRLTLLQTLAFDGCVNLKSLGEEIQFLNNLRKLWIGSCNNLESLPPNMKHMTTLHTLFIVNCEKLQVMMRSGEAPQGLRSLIIENSSLEALPPWLIGDTLQSIWLGECHNLTALPELIKFTFLEQLHIVECSKLSALPQGLHCLTELRELYIEGCPELSKSCKRQLKGEEWSKMARQVKITLDADDEEDEADNRLADSRISYQYPCGGRRGLLAIRCTLWRGS